MAPEISNVYPDFITPVSMPAIITGENFEPGRTEVRCWEPPIDNDAIIKRAGLFGKQDLPELPPEPPPDSTPAEIIDTEEQVIVAHLNGCVVWTGRAGQWSKPFIIRLPKPFWISHQQARAGELVHVAGRSLRQEGRGVSSYHYDIKPANYGLIVLRSGDHTFFVDSEHEGRSTQWVGDSRLIYFHIPEDAPQGRYEVFLHNGYGGEFGWVSAGHLDVLAGAEPEMKLVNVRNYGAAGDGLADDRPAIEAAMRALQPAGGVVYLPPGTYRIEATLRVQPGIRLHGAGKENTIIRGCGYTPPEPPAVLIRLTDHTELSELTICGAVSDGLPCKREERSDMANDGMIRIEPVEGSKEARDISIIGCRIRALEEEPLTREKLYLKAIHVGSDCFGHCSNVRINNNEIHGSLFFWRGRRMEIIRNKWYDSTPTILVSIHGWAIDSLLDSNIFTDTPGRLCFYPLRHCLIRSNEIHGAFKGSWTNAEEVYLVHGASDRYFDDTYRRTVSFVASACSASITDDSQSWADDEHRDCVVLIISGRGFGQYRYVTHNDAHTLEVDRPWVVQPDRTSEYIVARMYLENDFFANLNDTPLRMSLWMDCVSNVVDRHRDEFSKGIDLWARESRGSFYPAWYNVIMNGWMDGAAVWLSSSMPHNQSRRGEVMFGNFVAGNRIRQPHMCRTGFERQVKFSGGISAGGRQSHTILYGNQISFTTIGVVLTASSRKTLIQGNVFDNVESPILDRSGDAIIRDNKTIGRGDISWEEIERG